MKKERVGELRAVETAIYGWLCSGIHPSVIATALNNAFIHGHSIVKGGYELDDDDQILREIYDGIEKITAACKKIK